MRQPHSGRKLLKRAARPRNGWAGGRDPSRRDMSPAAPLPRDPTTLRRGRPKSGGGRLSAGQGRLSRTGTAGGTGVREGDGAPKASPPLPHAARDCGWGRRGKALPGHPRQRPRRSPQLSPQEERAEDSPARRLTGMEDEPRELRAPLRPHAFKPPTAGSGLARPGSAARAPPGAAAGAGGFFLSPAVGQASASRDSEARSLSRGAPVHLSQPRAAAPAAILRSGRVGRAAATAGGHFG